MANLDMSLDDIIRMNKSSRARVPNSGPGPATARRFFNRSASRITPYSFSKVRATETQLDNRMLAEERAAAAFYPIQGGSRVSVIETGTKLLISNLDYGVTDEDINICWKEGELFSDVGEINRCSVHYDRSGRSEGTAEVVFSRRSDAVAAIKRYNHVQLDGTPMKIEIVGVTNASTHMLPPASRGTYRIGNGAPVRNDGVQGRGGVTGQNQGRGRGMGKSLGRGRGGGASNISAQDLDAELDKYHSDAKETI